MTDTANHRGNEMPEIDDLLDAGQVKKLLRCSLPLVYAMATRHQLPCIRWECPGIGKAKPRTTVRFRKQDILTFIQKHYRG
jgi:hypothetical protein